MEEYQSLIRELEKRRNKLNCRLMRTATHLNRYRYYLSHDEDILQPLDSALIEQEKSKMADIQSTLTQVEKWLNEARKN